MKYDEECAVDSRPMMMLFLSNDSSLEISSWKPSASFVNLNGSRIISPSEEIAAAKWLSLAISMPTKIFMRLYLPFIKSDTMMSTIDYHRRLDRNKYSE